MHSMRRRLAALAAFLIGAGLFPLPPGDAGAARGENWAGWRGPDRNGISAEEGLPERWTDAENIAWKVELPGSGISGPIIWDDRVFLTDCDGRRLSNLHVICLSRDTGAEVWHRQLWGTAPTLYHATKSSMATPVPITDGKHVFSFFGTGDLFCHTVDGELVWQRSLATEYGEFENRFAASSSPLLFDNLVIVQCDHYGASYVLAVDKQTGANRWKADRPECWLSWSSPRLIHDPASGRDELLALGSHKLDAYDPRSGAPLWTVRGMSRECIPTPVFGNGLIYAVSGPKYPTVAIRPGGSGDVTDTNVAWTNSRGGPFVPSAILVGERYYLVDDAGIATCLDARDGSPLWQRRLSGRFTASPVAGDGKIYFTNEEGLTIVISADGEKYREIARNAVGEPVYASPAISQGKIYLRTARRLFAIGPSTAP